MPPLTPEDAPPAATERLTAAEFDALMARCGPFEPAPEIAIACSGGADSMALAVLAQGWARARRGRAVALIVDHGLRRGSAVEAKAVRDRLTGLGLDAFVLRWRGPRPQSGVQNAARAARYGLLERWCRRHHVLHLLLAHHCEDQAETLLHRLARSSGVDGLAAMAAVRETEGLRLLRPLLDVPRPRLRATLERRRIGWVEDPSNRDPAFARVRLRALAPALAAEGLESGAIAASARRMGSARRALERTTGAFLATYAAIHAEGYATVRLGGFARVADEIACRALEGLLSCIGGHAYPPRRTAVRRIADLLAAGSPFQARTLAGCRLAVAGERLVIAREAGRIVPALPAPGEEVRWDNRFRVKVPAGGDRAAQFRIAPLGRSGMSALADDADRARVRALPAAARPAIPVFFDGIGRAVMPHSGYGRARRNAASVLPDIKFCPLRAVGNGSFPVV